MVRRTLASFAIVALAVHTAPHLAERRLDRNAVRAPAADEDGHDLWLRYRLVANTQQLAEYRAAFSHLVVPGSSPTTAATRDELTRGLSGLLGRPVSFEKSVRWSNTLLVGTPATSSDIAALNLSARLRSLGDDGFLITSSTLAGKHVVVVAANTNVGALYGSFALLRAMQTQRDLASLNETSAPRIERRIIDHWDNLDRTIERGYAGKSLWNWQQLPDSLPALYRDYARAEASIGINGVSLTNVNANAKVLTPEYIAKVKALAGVFRLYGIRVYLTARFSAPIEIGGLKTADPLDPGVAAWWTAKTNEIYRAIPDFGGFVVKANSEGQPGPQDYHRTHADGANMLADALVPHGGVVMWRAFVYSNTPAQDRIKQAYDEFKPLDGQFRDNVMLQVKNGPLDFQPREPFHPLFGTMPKTPLVVELQITKEYLGEDTHLAYLGAYYEEVLKADTWASGRGSTVARVADGSLHGYKRTAIAGVSNVGVDRDWSGSHFNQANWYAFGRLAWDPTASAERIAEDWTRMTWTNDDAAVRSIVHLMMTSREAVVNYMEPLGLVHMMGTDHHYGPAPWIRNLRPDWTPVYYHRADSVGIGFDRTANGSDAIAQYSPQAARHFGDRDSVPDQYLLFFHHPRWSDTTRAGLTVWNDLVRHYYAGVDTVAAMHRAWRGVRASIDAQRFKDVDDFLTIQEAEAKWWRDAALLYFGTFSRMPLPPGYTPPPRPLDWYMSLHCPADATKPRCPDIYKLYSPQ
ncbi:MAG TPA: alpha-glucuronidase family glycosyl hydrolase [Gemmatimonadaceae bacterium]